MWIVRLDDYDWVQVLGVFDQEEDADAVAGQIPGAYADDVKYYEPGDRSLHAVKLWRVRADIRSNGTFTIEEPEQLQGDLVDCDGVVKVRGHQVRGEITSGPDGTPVALEVVTDDPKDAYDAVVAKLNEIVPELVDRYTMQLESQQEDLQRRLREATPL